VPTPFISLAEKVGYIVKNVYRALCVVLQKEQQPKVLVQILQCAAALVNSGAFQHLQRVYLGRLMDLSLVYATHRDEMVVHAVLHLVTLIISMFSIGVLMDCRSHCGLTRTVARAAQ
jgi:hypothetical protein